MRVTQRSLFYWILHRMRGLQLVLLAIILASLFFRVFPLEMQKRIINEAIHLRKTDLLILYCGLYMGAVFIAGLLKYAINVLQAHIGQKILKEMRLELYRHLISLPLSFYRKMPPGTVISAMSAELNAVGAFLGGALAVPVTSVLSFLVFMGFMFNLSPHLALLSMGVYPVEIFVIPMLQRRYNRLNRKRVRQTRAMNNVVNEAISGIHEIHANGSHRLEISRLGGFVRRLQRLMVRLFVFKYGIKFASNFFHSLGPFLLFLVGGYLAINGRFTIGALVAFLSAYEKVYDPWKELIEYYQALQDASVRYRQTMEAFDLPPEYPLLEYQGDVQPLRGDIELDKVGFVVGSGVRLLENINLRIPAGTHTALVGFSGSGKSTLALLITRLYTATEGAIRISGRNLAEIHDEELRSSLAMVAQHPFVFSGSIRDNLLYAVRAVNRPEPGLEELAQVIRDVGLYDDVISFALGTVLSPEQGARLKNDILRMRRIIRETLAEQYGDFMEFYDPERFLYYVPLGENIVFGESTDGRFALEALPRQPAFMAVLRKTGLVEPLLELGLEIVRASVDLLTGLADDEFFFQGSTVRPEELDACAELLAACGEGLPADEAARAALLVQALRFVPARHNIASLPGGDFIQRILEARHIFLEEVVGVDIETCMGGGGEDFHTILPSFTEEKNFIPFCPTEYLARHSLRDNILFGTIKESETARGGELRRLTLDAFEQQGLLTEIIDVGLDFDVGSQGDRLSGGQKQKIAIARTLLKKAPILILDEATSALDNASEARVAQVLDRLRREGVTIVSVLHRLDQTRTCDNIVVLKAGRIVEQGTHDQLMEQQGAFYALNKGHMGRDRTQGAGGGG